MLNSEDAARARVIYLFGGHDVPFVWTAGQTKILEPSSWTSPGGCAHAINDAGVPAASYTGSQAGIITDTSHGRAKIIDIRREPMAACFAVYKQLLPMEPISCDLNRLGRYYNQYVQMMEHWKSAMPGHIHFVQYERLVEDTENEIRRMLAYCGLPFEEGCLRYWETDRAVITPSAEQVRRPIYRDAMEQWRNFEPWLAPLIDSLGSVLTEYPEVPEELR